MIKKKKKDLLKEDLRETNLKKLDLPISILIFDFLSVITDKSIKKYFKEGLVKSEYQPADALESILFVIGFNIMPEEKTGFQTLEDINSRKIGDRLSGIDWTKRMSAKQWINMTTFLGEFTEYLNYLKMGVWSEDIMEGPNN